LKFSHGYWLVKDGFTVHPATEIRDVESAANTLTVYNATRTVRHKGDTLNSPLLTAEISAPRPDIIRVRWTRHSGRRAAGPAFALHLEPDSPATVTEDAGSVTLTSGTLSVTIAKTGPWSAEFAYSGRRLTGSGLKGPAHITAADKQVYMREQLDLGVGEHIYGLGERFTPFVKNGQTVDIWNEDPGTSSEQAYKNVPFYMSSAGYGVFVNHPGRVSFEVGSEVVSKVQFSVPGESLDYCIIGGSTPKDVLASYTALTGRPALPPPWSFGLWLTTSFTTDYDEATVNRFIDGMAERDLPLHVFHFDCFWMKEYQWTDFEWDPAVFPDPAGMLRRLKERGLRICVWINPYIGQKSPLFREGMERGYLLKTAGGDVWQWDQWQAGMGIVDFTNPGAVAWYQAHLRRLLAMGVDSFKTDFGERIPTDDVVYHDGSDPLNMHNYYSFLYNKTVFDVLEDTLGKHKAMVFARSATAGSQMFPVHWGGDCSATYVSMAETLRGGLSLGLSGFGFWSHDISGFERTAPPDIYKRWVAFGLLSSHSRLHGNESYRVPWLFDEEAVDVLRHFTRLKCALMPYLFAGAVEAAASGVPLLRAMALEFPADRTCLPLDTQYMLGERLLVAPIFNDRGLASYYVPAGRWTDLLTGRVVEGGRWYDEQHGYMTLPLLVRPNSLIAVGANDRRPDYDFAAGVTLHLFELADGAAAEAVVHDHGGAPVLAVRAARSGRRIELTVERGAATFTVLLRGVSELAAVHGGAWAPHELGAAVTPDGGGGRVLVEL